MIKPVQGLAIQVQVERVPLQPGWRPLIGRQLVEPYLLCSAGEHEGSAEYWDIPGFGRLFGPYAQRFLSVHGVVLNLFRVGRHLLRAVHHRLSRSRAFGVWREVTCV